MNSLLLTEPTDLGGWDLTVDASGNIALATGPYAIAQNVASAVRTFLGEVWYDTTFGMPYFEQILGYLPSLNFVRQRYVTVAGTVQEVASVTCFFTGPGKSRQLGGQLQITDTSGGVSVAGTNLLQGVAPWYVTAISP